MFMNADAKINLVKFLKVPMKSKLTTLIFQYSLQIIYPFEKSTHSDILYITIGNKRLWQLQFYAN